MSDYAKCTKLPVDQWKACYAAEAMGSGGSSATPTAAEGKRMYDGKAVTFDEFKTAACAKSKTGECGKMPADKLETVLRDLFKVYPEASKSLEDICAGKGGKLEDGTCTIAGTKFWNDKVHLIAGLKSGLIVDVPGIEGSLDFETERAVPIGFFIGAGDRTPGLTWSALANLNVDVTTGLDGYRSRNAMVDLNFAAGVGYLFGIGTNGGGIGIQANVGIGGFFGMGVDDGGNENSCGNLFEIKVNPEIIIKFSDHVGMALGYEFTPLFNPAGEYSYKSLHEVNGKLVIEY